MRATAHGSVEAPSRRGGLLACALLLAACGSAPPPAEPPPPAERAAVEPAPAEPPPRTEAPPAIPDAPELGGTLEEARILCARQGGEARQAELSGVVGEDCRVGDARIFAVRLEGEPPVVVEVDVFITGRSLASVRDRFAAQLGPPQEHVDSRGVRVFTWRTVDQLRQLRMTQRGLWLTVRQTQPPGAVLECTGDGDC
jgi:putative hemolysin